MHKRYYIVKSTHALLHNHCLLIKMVQRVSNQLNKSICENFRAKFFFPRKWKMAFMFSGGPLRTKVLRKSLGQKNVQ
jgi:hypothetical protein